MRIVSVAAVAAFVLAGMSSGIAHAEKAPGCGTVPQIGKTAYIGWEAGQQLASVKQFVGCGKNWAYVYVWDTYHNYGNDYKVSAAILTPTATKGHKKGANRQREVWSSGTDTVNVCTQAQGYIYDDPEFAPSATTEKRC